MFELFGRALFCRRFWPKQKKVGLRAVAFFGGGSAAAEKELQQCTSPSRGSAVNKIQDAGYKSKESRHKIQESRHKMQDSLFNIYIKTLIS
ncbi:hypothetical protein EIB71_08565 [Kaistella daneshvariae]|uniref:Uncharacterized protein n=1 Tax=Kaistella daneshvariae TaxID=2487074 RepID=A0ABM7C9N4_9FLAO|nr:hypothetical protein [Kaistella daneshvariae]AZI67713.1 hypothetical protein EIB71_08565 [Kaistella daneshvariae]